MRSLPCTGLSSVLLLASSGSAHAGSNQQGDETSQSIMTDQSVDIPLSTFHVSNAAYTCVKGNSLPTLGIDYADGHKSMDFNEVSTGVGFVLSDPVKSVRYFVKDNKHGWTIHASGLARQAEGVESGAMVNIEMTIWRDGGADWIITADKLRQEAVGCMRIPPRPRMLEPQ